MKTPLPPRTTRITLLGLLIASIVGWGCATNSFHFNAADASNDQFKAGDSSLAMNPQKHAAESSSRPQK